MTRRMTRRYKLVNKSVYNKNQYIFGKDKIIELQPTKIQRDIFEYFQKNSGSTYHICHNNLFLGSRAKKKTSLKESLPNCHMGSIIKIK